jgi:hypothetical protein
LGLVQTLTLRQAACTRTGAWAWRHHRIALDRLPFEFCALHAFGLSYLDKASQIRMLSSVVQDDISLPKFNSAG